MEDYVQSKINNFYKHLPNIRQLKLFSNEELKIIEDKWKRFARAIAEKDRLDDYKNCIKWEKSLLLKFRQKQNGERCDWLAKLILLDYERALLSYHKDFSLNEDYFHFLRSLASNGSGKKLDDSTSQLKRMIDLFPSRLEVFRLAANWYYSMGEISEAKGVLFRGVQQSPNNDDLYIDLVDLLMKNREHADFNSDIHKLVDIMKKNEAHVELFKGLIETLENISGSEVLIDYVIEVMLRQCKDKPETWYAIALRELKGKHWPSTERVQQSTDAAIDRCNKIFKRGLRLLPKEKKKLLYKLYVDTFSYIVKEYSTAITENMLKEAVELVFAHPEEVSGFEYDMPLIKLYLKYFPNCENVIVEKLEQAIKSEPTSLPLWSTYITYILSKPFKKIQVRTTIDQASKDLGRKVIKLYDLYFTYLEINFPDDAGNEYNKILDECKNGLTNDKLHEDVLGELKVRYLSYSIVKVRDHRDSRGTKDITLAYELYKKLAETPPYHRDLHTEMIRAAETCLEDESSSEILDKTVDLWIKQFGATDPDPYLQKMEIIINRFDADDLASVETNYKLNGIYQDATLNLTDAAKGEFIRFYNEKIKFYKRLAANNGSPPHSEDTDYSESELTENKDPKAH